MEKQIQDQFQSQNPQNQLQKNKMQNLLQNQKLHQNLDLKQISGINPENIRTIISKSSNSLLNQNILGQNPNRPDKVHYMPKGFFSKQYNAIYSSKGLLLFDTTSFNSKECLYLFVIAMTSL